MTRVRQTGDLSKPHTLHSRAIMDFAKDQPCTLRIPGVCNGDPATTVCAHLPGAVKSMGSKVSDLHSVHACSDCHDVLDGRKPKPWVRNAEAERDKLLAKWIIPKLAVAEWTESVMGDEFDFQRSIIRAIAETNDLRLAAGLLTMIGSK